MLFSFFHFCFNVAVTFTISRSSDYKRTLAFKHSSSPLRPHQFHSSIISTNQIHFYLLLSLSSTSSIINITTNVLLTVFLIVCRTRKFLLLIFVVSCLFLLFTGIGVSCFRLCVAYIISLAFTKLTPKY